MIAGIIAAHYVALTGYPAAVMADSPLGYWRLGEASGATAADASGNSRHGTIVGTPASYGVAPPVGMGGDTAITLDADSYLSVTNAAWMNVSAITVECWFKTTNTAQLTLIGRSATGLHAIIDYLSTNSLRWYVAGASVGSVSVTTNLRDGNWHHVVGTYDGANQRLFVDGAQVATAAATGTITASGDFRVGRRVDDASTTPMSVDEAAFYGTALSAARIAAHYTAGTTP